MPTLLNPLRTCAIKGLYAVLSGFVALAFAPVLALLRFGANETRIRTRERWGRHGNAFKKQLGRKGSRRIWIHAVSVGEVDVALSLIETLHSEDPDTEFVLTMVTREGRQLAERNPRRNVHLSYAPFDFAGAVRRSFKTFHTDMLVLVELEIWPNQLWKAQRLGIPVAIVNGRLPERDHKKYRCVRWFMRDIFGLLSLVCTQTQKDAEAFYDLGVARARIQVTGSMKMDAALKKAERPPGDECLPSIWQTIALRTLVVGGSTHPGEEAMLFAMVPQLKAEFPDFLLVVAPRDTSRAKKLVHTADQKGLIALEWSQVSKQSSLKSDIIVVDTIGDLERFYGRARVVFIGKSLTAMGGQNPMEPAAAGRPVLFGPSMENFSFVVEQLLRSRAAIQVADADHLETEILGLLRNPKAADALGRAGREVVLANTGATKQTVLQLIRLLNH